MHNISIFGTSSDAGKSTITFVIGKILQEIGVNVTPFKAQNVSNNSHIADDGSEIAIAQYFQADVLGVETSYHLNPILLKSGKGNKASLILNGQVVEDRDVLEYYRTLDGLKPAVKEVFEYLDKRYDCVICEGAGSPVELNLMDKDLSNIFIANEYNTKIILVADIEKGGVFASIYGVYNLLPKKLQKNVIGVIVNKFRGDMTLFDKGRDIIENEFGISVLGVLPYTPFNLGFEDSASLKNFTQDCSKSTRKVAVISYPYMSNYNDFEPLIADSNTCVEFIDTNISLDSYDCIILPGSKMVIKDLKWLKASGLFTQIEELEKKQKNHIVGICGGYQMLFENIIDKECIEVEKPTQEKGFGFIDDDIVYQKEKTLKKDGDIFEIHHGISKKYPKEYKTDNIYGTFNHGLFIDDWFRNHKKEVIAKFMDTMKEHLDIKRIIKSVS
ncbi:MAG: cobyric acid synthase [Campylobacterota bacterium]|nr:cobyric acid synthase [Campylobacterota bacterium]